MRKFILDGELHVRNFIFPVLFVTMIAGSIVNDDPSVLTKTPLIAGRNSGTAATDEYLEKESGDSITAIYFRDSFDGANDTNSLKSRGYKIFYRGTGPQGTSAIWFQGSSLLFPAFNGPSTGYVASNFNSVTSQNRIDNWLILPKRSITRSDSIYFYSRSMLNSIYPDSIRVMYSQTGDSIPEGNWAEIGRFKVNTSGFWERRGFRAGNAGPAARFAIRYTVADGGPSGINSDYIGIDEITLVRTNLSPVNVKALNIIAPQGYLASSSGVLAPIGRFINSGANFLTNIPVSMSISGPVSYNSTKVIPQLNTGDSITVTFDSTFLPSVGSYSATMVSQMPGDTVKTDDTAKGSFIKLQENFGVSSGIAYSNSVSSGAPSKPEFCLRDTTGSLNLVLNGLVKRPDLFTGSIDNGYFRLGGLFKNGNGFRFGSFYDSMFISTNGLIAFSQANVNLANANPDTTGFPSPALFPFWSDLNFGTLQSSVNRLCYKVMGDALVLISFDRAPLKSQPSSYVSFQVLIDAADNFHSNNSRVLFLWCDTVNSRTSSEFISSYFAGTVQPLVAGIALSQSQKFFYRSSKPYSVGFPGPLFSSTAVGLQMGPDQNRLNHTCEQGTLQLGASLEAITPDGSPSSNTSDTLSVLLRESTAPYEPADVVKLLLSNSGVASAVFRHIKSGRQYYIVPLHRNSIETWSSGFFSVASPGSASAYDFRTSIAKAFGSNMKTVEGSASLFTGDVDTDGFVDVSDISLVDNDATQFLSGYNVTDLNNDGIVDLADLVFADNSASQFVTMVRP